MRILAVVLIALVVAAPAAAAGKTLHVVVKGQDHAPRVGKQWHYSVRPKPGAPVSTPLRWDELDGRLDYRDFTMAAARERLEREGDLFSPVLETRQALGPALRTLRRTSRT